MLYALVLTALLADLSITTATAGLLGSLTLIASGLGGVLFGALADRIGRRPAMIGSILVYSVFTAACGLSQNIWQLGVFRFLLGLGMGGEWTSGAAMVSETWPDRHRGKAVAIMQSSWAVGYAVAALVVAFVLPTFGWRAVFFVGLLPALLTLWIRRGIEESEVWLASKKARSRRQGGDGPRRVSRALCGHDRTLDDTEHVDDFRVLGPESLGARVPLAPARTRRARAQHDVDHRFS